MDSGSAPERANFPSPSRPSRCILGPRPPSFSNDNSNTASAEMFSPDPYSLVAASTQARNPQTSAIVPAFIPNDPQAQHPVIDPRLYEQGHHDQGSAIGTPYHPSLEPTAVENMASSGQPGFLMAGDPMLDQALGGFFPHAAGSSHGLVDVSQFTSYTPGHRPDSNAERYELTFSAGNSRKPAFSYHDNTPCVNDPDSSPPLGLSNDAAGKRKASSMVEASPEPKTSKRKKDAIHDAKPALVGQKAPRNWKKQDGLRASSPAIKPSGMYFSCLTEAESRMAAPDWMPPAGDVVPTTDAELAPFVAQLTDAMKDMSQFKDNINTKLKKRWLDATIQRSGQPGAVLSNNFYMPHVLEALAWKIATMIQRLHLSGPGTIQCLDPLILENSFDDRHLTFEERMSIFVDVCRFRKTRVMGMLDGGDLERAVLTPSIILTASETSARANSKRAGMIKEGRSTWIFKNPDKAKRQMRGVSRGRGSVRRGGLGIAGRDESRETDQSGFDELTAEVMNNTHPGRQGRLNGNASLNDTGIDIGDAGSSKPDDEDVFDDGMAQGSDEDGIYDSVSEDEEALSGARTASRTADDGDDSAVITPTSPVRPTRAGALANSAKNKHTSTIESQDNEASEVAKGKRKVDQGDEKGMLRPRRKAVRKPVVLRDSDSVSLQSEKKRKRHNDGAEDNGDGDFPAPYVGKGKGKAAAKRGRQE